MSGLDKNRHRNRTISFRVSEEESRKLEARIIVAGLLKGDFIRQSVLKDNILISVGKYQSDRLSLELRRMREDIQIMMEKNNADGISNLLLECNDLLEMLLEAKGKSTTELDQ